MTRGVFSLGFLATILTSSLALPLRIRRDDVQDQRSSPAVDFFDPYPGGGSMLDRVASAKGEPLNVIISGKSSPKVILTQDGFVNYMRAIGFSGECLGLHRGNPQSADLGDGHGSRNEGGVMRQHFGFGLAFSILDTFGIDIIGTCVESITGGNHFRYFRQDGHLANSGAIFLAVSQEMDATQTHKIVPNGYNLGRDKLVRAATGVHSFRGITYLTTVQKRDDVLRAGKKNVNHGIAQDGIIALLTVTIVGRDGVASNPTVLSKASVETQEEQNDRGVKQFPDLDWLPR